MNNKFIYIGLLALVLAIVLLIIKWGMRNSENFEDATLPQMLGNENEMNSSLAEVKPQNTPSMKAPTPTKGTEILDSNAKEMIKSLGMRVPDLSMPTLDNETASMIESLPTVKTSSQEPTTTVATSMMMGDNTSSTMTAHNSQNYTILEETYVEEDGLNTKALYKNYKGVGGGDKVWTNVNLDQCYELCNKLEGCTGFSRPLKNSINEPGTCFPRTSIDNCHSSRKGNLNQRNNAANYNTYIKTSSSNFMTRCIGDQKTLTTPIMFKSVLFPSRFIGIKDNEVVLMDMPKDASGMIAFYSACRFELIVGMDGSGTLSVKHIDTNKTLYRGEASSTDKQPTMLLEAMNIEDISSTKQKQRASFYLDDGKVPPNIRLKCFLVDGEKIPKYITINPNNSSRLVITEVDSKNINPDFEIIDTISGKPISSIETQPTEKFADISQEQIDLEKIQTLLGGMKSPNEFKNFVSF